jgi:hypothetical protein
MDARMTADQPLQPPEPPPSFPDGKRKPPTIDLTATEVETASAAEPVSGPAPDDVAPAVTAADAPPPPESPAPETTSAPTSAAEPPPASPAPPRRRSAAGLIGAGIVGGAVAAGAVFAANLFLASDSDTSALEARLAGVELELRELRSRDPGTAGTTDPRALDELTARIAKLEAAVAAPKPAPLDPALANRISAIEGQVKAMAETVGVLGRRHDEIAALAGEAKARAEAASAAAAELARKLSAQPAIGKAEIDTLAARIATTEQELGKLAARPPGDDRVSRLAIATTALRSVVERGEPYAAELAAAKALGVGAAALGALEPFAATGLPSARQLAREISDLAPALLQAAGGAPRDSTFLERLQSNAERLVRIRRIEEVAGSDPTSVVARIEVKAAHGDLAGALAELTSLPEAARAPAEAWIKKAQARAAAVDAARKLSADALAGLSK